jgi:hypothetical protein
MTQMSDMAPGPLVINMQQKQKKNKKMFVRIWLIVDLSDVFSFFKAMNERSRRALAAGSTKISFEIFEDLGKQTFSFQCLENSTTLAKSGVKSFGKTVFNIISWQWRSFCFKSVSYRVVTKLNLSLKI